MLRYLNTSDNYPHVSKCALLNLFTAFVCAEKALALNPNSANVHKWYAITLGSIGEFISINEKIQNGYKFKEHIDKAILISPTDSTLHYLLGRFCYEVHISTYFFIVSLNNFAYLYDITINKSDARYPIFLGLRGKLHLPYFPLLHRPLTKKL